MGEFVSQKAGRRAKRVDTVRDVLGRHECPDTTSNERVLLVGRIVGIRRSKAGMLFLDLNDGSGVLQLVAGDYTAEIVDFERLIASGRPMIQAYGRVFRTKGDVAAVRLLHWEEV